MTRDHEALARIMQPVPLEGAPVFRVLRSAEAQLRPNERRHQQLDWLGLEARGEPPPRRWGIRGWLGFGHVTLLVGAGGIGKTLLAQQAGSCLSLGRTFLDAIPDPLRVLFWACEDDHDELWRRQINIARWLDVPLSGFAERLIVEPRAGLDNVLVTSEFGRPRIAPLLDELREQAHDYRAKVVILDNVAQLYGGSENDRHSVTMFINALVGALPGCAILLLAHPSRSAGSEFSGSSAWENAARTRLYLGTALPDQKGDDGEPSDGVRFLSRRKANYSSKDYRRFSYREGVLVPDETEVSGGIVSHLRGQKAQRVVVEGLRRLEEMGVRATDGTTSPQYLPRLLQDYKLAEGLSRRELGDAMRQAMLDGRLIRGVVGKYGNRAPMQGLRIAKE